MKIKTTLTSIALGMLFIGTVKADSGTSNNSDLFRPGFSLSGYASYLNPGNNKGTEKAWGGGIGGEYFFTSMLGVAGSANWSDPGTDDIWRNYALDLVLRVPFESFHIAPYALVGAGAVFEDDTRLLFRAGAGLDLRFTSSVGVFADWIHNFPSGDNLKNYQFIRIGAKINF